MKMNHSKVASDVKIKNPWGNFIDHTFSFPFSQIHISVISKLIDRKKHALKHGNAHGNAHGNQL